MDQGLFMRLTVAMQLAQLALTVILVVRLLDGRRLVTGPPFSFSFHSL